MDRDYLYTGAVGILDETADDILVEATLGMSDEILHVLGTDPLDMVLPSSDEDIPVLESSSDWIVEEDIPVLEPSSDWIVEEVSSEGEIVEAMAAMNLDEHAHTADAKRGTIEQERVDLSTDLPPLDSKTFQLLQGGAVTSSTVTMATEGSQRETQDGLDHGDGVDNQAKKQQSSAGTSSPVTIATEGSQRDTQDGLDHGDGVDNQAKNQHSSAPVTLATEGSHQGTQDVDDNQSKKQQSSSGTSSPVTITTEGSHQGTQDLDDNQSKKQHSSAGTSSPVTIATEGSHQGTQDMDDNQSKKQQPSLQVGRPLASACSAHPRECFVGLNVGGVVYQTTRKTLTRYPDSLLGKLFNGAKLPPQDTNGNFLIDGDGAMFKYVLNYLRRGSLCLPDDFREHDILEKEALFFELPKIVQKVISHKRSSERKDSAVIEAYVRERDNCIQEWRIHGSLSFLDEVSVLNDYLGSYRKGSQCVNFNTQHSMFLTDVFRRFPKTKLFAQIFALGFRLHTTDNVNIMDDDEDSMPWLRYVFVK